MRSIIGHLQTMLFQLFYTRRNDAAQLAFGQRYAVFFLDCIHQHAVWHSVYEPLFKDVPISVGVCAHYPFIDKCAYR